MTLKTALLYLLLLSYTSATFKPAIPFVSDFMAHAFWYSHHMATVHYEHGKYHVHYEILSASKKEGGQKNADLPKANDHGNEHLVIQPLYNFKSVSAVLLHSQRWIADLPSIASGRLDPPPRHEA